MFEVLHFARQVVTDANGEFRIDHVVPGHEFRLAFSKGTKNLGPKRRPGPAVHGREARRDGRRSAT